MILIATDAVGGPGKGLFQFLTRVGHGDLHYELCNFQLGESRLTPFMEEARRRGVDVTYIRQRHSFDPSIFSQALQIFDRQGFDIVQSHGYKSHAAAWYIASRRNVPWIAYTHGATDENIKIRIYNLLERFLLRSPDVAVGVSPQLLETLIHIRGDDRRSELVLNAVDPAEIRRRGKAQPVRSQYGIEEGHFLIGSFGRLSPEKGHDLLLAAVAEAKRSVSQLRLIVAGDGQLEDELRRRAVELGLENDVTFVAHRSNIGDYLDAIDLLVLPSRSEGLPNIVLESMSQETPVLATNVGAVGEIIRNDENGWIVPSEDPMALAGALVRIADNRARLPEVGRIARKSLTPKFCPEARARRMLSIYSDVLLANHQRESNNRWTSNTDS